MIYTVRSSRTVFNIFIKIGTDGTFMGKPISEFTKCRVDSDCINAARTCSIGCGNKEEVKPFN